MRIGLDAMGGDFAPQVTVEGALEALPLLDSDSTLVLFGDQAVIQALLPENFSSSKLEIVHTSQVIEMGDHPAQAFQKKADSSIVVGFNHLISGLIDGFASAGSTGAMMVGCMMGVKAIEGVIRPSIAVPIMTASGREVTILDVGLNADCKPEVLYQYAIIGNIFAREIVGIPSPRVALLNIGEEEGKGNLLTKATYPLMAANDGAFNFVGNIEANHLFDGSIADVVVCDGFSGNTILKQAEGLYELLRRFESESEMLRCMNYEIIGGTPVLGINSNVIIGHGCSTAKAIKNMVLATERTIRAGIVPKFKEAFS